MSKIQATPFIQKVIATLSTEEQASLAALINGSDTEPSFKSLINPIYKITSEDQGVSYCTLETQDKTFTGYLLYTDAYCVFVAFAQDTQSLSVLNIDLANQTYKFVEESLTILELRFSLEEIKEPTDIIGTVQNALDDDVIKVTKLDSEGQTYNNYLAADGNGGTYWAEPREIEQGENIATFDNVSFVDDSATLALESGDARWTIMTDTTKDCSLVLRLTDGSKVEMKRVRYDDTYVEFGSTLNEEVDGNGVYASIIYSAKFISTGGVAKRIEIEANKDLSGDSDDEHAYLSNITIGGETYYVINDVDMAEKADIEALLDGALIPNKALQAKSIEAVSTESGAVQDTPFIYQGTGTANGTSITDTSPVGKHLEKQGNSVVVNQLLDISNGSGSSNGLDWETDGTTKVISASGTANSTWASILQYSTKFVKDNIYLTIANVTKNTNNKSFSFFTQGSTNPNVGVYVDAVGVFYGLRKSTISINNPYMGLNNITANEAYDIELKVVIIDLTQWFAGNIPEDLLDHPENFFRYYNGSLDYNAGTLENGTGRYLTCGGRNVWDEEWELGAINYDTGAEVYSSTSIRSKWIRVKPNGSYYFHLDSWGGSACWIIAYDANKNFISGVVSTMTADRAFEVPANCRYIRFRFNSGYGTTYNNDITISLYYETGDSYDQYFPYEEPKVYDTGSEVLRSAGSVKDVKAPDGTITRKVSQVDLGAKTWAYQRIYGSVYGFVAYQVGAKKNGNATSDRYSCATDFAVFVNNDKIIRMDTNAIEVIDSSYTDPAAFKTAVSGVYLVYELAEPTTEQGTPFAENIEINDYGTMGWDSEVPQGCKIFYPADYALFIDSVGQRQDINWDALAIVSHTELNNETDALEAKDTQLLNAVGGTLRQLLAVSKSIDFADTAFVDLGELSWGYSNGYFYVSINDIKSQEDTSQEANLLCTKYENYSWDALYYLDNGACLAYQQFRIKDSSYTDATAFKNAMKGVLLAYEKAE